MKQRDLITIAVVLSIALSGSGPAGAGRAAPLTVTPDDGIGPIVELIKGSSGSVDLVASRLDDQRVIEALASAASRGVKVRVMLEKNPSSGADANRASEQKLRSAHVFTSWSDPAFSSMMARAVISDKRAAAVLSFDLVTDEIDRARGFAVTLRDARDVADLVWMFDSDWSRVRASPLDSSLVWEPNGARSKLLSIIRNATASIDIYADDVRDPEIQQAIAQATKRGVTVRVLAGPKSGDDPAGLTKVAMAGASVRHMKEMPLAARAMTADDGRKGRIAMIGISMLEAYTKKETRGLGVLISDEERLARLTRAFANDWKTAR